MPDYRWGLTLDAGPESAAAERATDYRAFLDSKARVFQGAGIEVDPEALHPSLFPFQRDLTRWALRKGRAAIWADCGLGKTLMQLEWAQQILEHAPAGSRVLIAAPLTVAQQTVAEAARFAVTDASYARHQYDSDDGVLVTNYEMIEHFDPAAFVGVVLDESSILRNETGVYRRRLTEMFAQTPYRLCCTATPAPNDVQEFTTHSEFLGILSRVEMLATWFVHDDEGWRLKRHARERFYAWLASWGMAVGKPSDLGYSDEGYELPPLGIHSSIVGTEFVPEGQLFATALHGVSDRAKVRRGTLSARVARAMELIEAEPEHQWIAWCGLNDESSALARALPDAIEVEGSQSPDEKTRRLQAFMRGEHRILVSKPRVAGLGLNLQCAARQVFVGLSDSYQDYYQCIRRSYRFGQTQPIEAHIVLSDLEQPIYENVLRKEREARDAQAQLIKHAVAYERAEIAAVRGRDPYNPQIRMEVPAWLCQ